MSGLNAYNILNYGVIGLGFLLAVLAYNLLRKEQQKVQPSKSILIAIHVFMIFSIILCVIGFGSEYLHKTPDPSMVEEVGHLQTQLNAQTLLLQKYRDQQSAYMRNNADLVHNLKLLASLPFVPSEYKDTLKQAIDTLQAPVIEDK